MMPSRTCIEGSSRLQFVSAGSYHGETNFLSPKRTPRIEFVNRPTACRASPSVLASIQRPSRRLVAAQRAAQAFVDGMPKKFRVGVIGFTGRAYVAVPPTEDRVLVRSALRSLKSGQGTALGDAVALGTRLARAERTSDGKIPPTAMLVISDGAQKSGRTTPTAAATQARSLHIPVYTVVIGTQDGVVNVPLAGGFKAQLRVPPEPETLRDVARMTGGQFFTAPDKERLRQIYEKLGSRLGHRRESREITDLFAGGSAAFLVFGGALSALWFRRVP